MNIVLAAINAKYIHSNLAVYSLRAYAQQYKDEIQIAEYTINQQIDDILMDLYKKKPDVLCFSCYIWNLSYVEELIHAGIMEREEGRFHPKKNVITRALGTVMATPDFFEFDAKDGYLLLCSDGLSNMISDEELKELLLDHSQIANKVNQMITRANEYGGKDNISLVIVDLKR